MNTADKLETVVLESKDDMLIAKVYSATSNTIK